MAKKGKYHSLVRSNGMEDFREVLARFKAYRDKDNKNEEPGFLTAKPKAVYLFFQIHPIIFALMKAVDNDLTKVQETLLAFNTKIGVPTKLTSSENTYNPNYVLNLLSGPGKLAIKAEPTLENSYKIYIQQSHKFLESTDVRLMKTALKKTFELVGVGVFYENGQKFITIASPVNKIRIELNHCVNTKLIQDIIISYWLETVSEDLFEVQTIGGATSPIIVE